MAGVTGVTGLKDDNIITYLNEDVYITVKIPL